MTKTSTVSDLYVQFKFYLSFNTIDFFIIDLDGIFSYCQSSFVKRPITLFHFSGGKFTLAVFPGSSTQFSSCYLMLEKKQLQLFSLLVKEL